MILDIILFTNAFGTGAANMEVITLDLPPPRPYHGQSKGSQFLPELLTIILTGYATYRKNKIGYDP